MTEVNESTIPITAELTYNHIYFLSLSTTGNVYTVHIPFTWQGFATPPTPPELVNDITMTPVDSMGTPLASQTLSLAQAISYTDARDESGDHLAVPVTIDTSQPVSTDVLVIDITLVLSLYLRTDQRVVQQDLQFCPDKCRRPDIQIHDSSQLDRHSDCAVGPVEVVEFPRQPGTEPDDRQSRDSGDIRSEIEQSRQYDQRHGPCSLDQHGNSTTRQYSRGNLYHDLDLHRESVVSEATDRPAAILLEASRWPRS